MTAVAASGGLADFGGVAGSKVQEATEGAWLQVGLVAQHDCPVGEGRVPAGPLGGALDGAEHAAIGGGVGDAVGGGEAEAVQLRLDGGVTGRAHHSDLIGTQGPPLLD